MADVALTIGGHIYSLACADGEEEHLHRLGELVAEQVAAAHAVAPGMSEARQLLFAAIYLADRLETEQRANADRLHAEQILASSLNDSSHRIESVCEKIEIITSKLA